MKMDKTMDGWAVVAYDDHDMVTAVYENDKLAVYPRARDAWMAYREAREDVPGLMWALVAIDSQNDIDHINSQTGRN